MSGYVLRRFLMLGPVLLFVSFLSFSIIHITPGDPAEILLTGPGGGADPKAVEEFRVQMGFDRPFHEQYLNWLFRALHGDLGYSYMSDRPVSQMVYRAFWPTLKLAFVSMIFSLLISIPAGVLAALNHDTWIDGLSRFISLLGVSIPNFWQGFLFLMCFSLTFKLLPVGGYGNNGDFEHILLPAVTLGTSSAAVTMRMMRNSMLEVLGEDYLNAARARGLSEGKVLGKHAFKNALLPVVTLAGLNFGYLLNGSVVVETVFAWPGLGSLVVNSIYNRDFPLIQGSLLFVALLFVSVNFLVDLSYSYLDPRIRYDASV